MVGQRSRLVGSGLPCGQHALVEQVFGCLALLLDRGGLKVAPSVDRHVLAAVDAQLADLEPALGVGLGEADADEARGLVDALAGLDEHVAREVRGVRHPLRLLRRCVLARIGDLAIAVDVENRLPLGVRSVGPIGDLDHAESDVVEAGLGDEVLNALNRALLAQVENDLGAHRGTAAGLGGGGDVAVEDLGDVEGLGAGQLALHDAGREGVQIAASERLEVDGCRIRRGAIADKAGADGIGSLERDPLDAVLGVDEVGLRRALGIRIGEDDVAADRTEVDGDDVALLGQGHRPVGGLEGAVTHTGGETDVRKIKRGVEIVLGIRELLERIELEKLEPVAGRGGSDELHARCLHAVERDGLLRSGGRCGELGPFAVRRRCGVGSVVKLGGGELIGITLLKVDAVDELGGAERKHHVIVCLGVAAAPELAIRVSVDNVGDRVVLVLRHVGGRGRSRLDLTEGSMEVDDAPPLFGIRAVDDLDGLRRHGTGQLDGLGLGGGDHAGLVPEAVDVLVISLAGLDDVIGAATLLEGDRGDGLGGVERHLDGGVDGGGVPVLALVLELEPRLGVLTVRSVLKGLASVGGDLVGDAHGAGEHGVLFELLVHRNLVDGRPGVLAVVAHGDDPHALDALDVEAGEGNLAGAELLGALDVGPLAALEVLDLAGVHEVLAAALDEGHGLKIEGLAAHHAEVVTLDQLVRALVDGAGLGVAVEDGGRAAHGRVGAAGHQLGDHGVGVGRQGRLLGGIGVESKDHRGDVRLADARVLIMVDVPQGVPVGTLQEPGALGVLGDEGGRIPLDAGLHGLELGERRGGQVIPSVEPGLHLLRHRLGPGVLAIGLGGALQVQEDLGHLVDVGCGHRIGGELGTEVRELLLDIGRLVVLPCRASAVHALHVAGQLAQGVGALRLLARVVINVAEGLLPHLVGMLGGAPQIPSEVRGHEDALLGRLGLLHRVDDDALDLARLEIGAEEVVVSAHVQGVLVVVRAGPVDPHEGSDTRIVLEGGGEGVVDLAPDPAAGVDHLDVLAKRAVPVLTLAHVGDGAEDQRVLEAGVLGRAVGILLVLELAKPCGRFVEEPLVKLARVIIRALVRTELIPGIVGEDRDLARARIDHLEELGLHDLEGLIVVVLGDGVVHEGVQRVNETHLGLVARLCEGLDLLVDLRLGVFLTPLSVVLGVVLGGVEVGVELVVAAPLHQRHAVAGAPGIAVVALDEAAGDYVGVIAGNQGAQRAIVILLQDLENRRQAVERRIGILAQNDDAISGAILGGKERDQVRIGPLEQLGIVGQLLGVHELLDIRVDLLARTVHADQHRGAVRRDGVRALDALGLELDRLVETGLGVAVDAGLDDRGHGIGELNRSLLIGDLLRCWEYLIIALLSMRSNGREQRSHAGRRRYSERGDPATHTLLHPASSIG